MARKTTTTTVLILVLVEDGLGDLSEMSNYHLINVLILVLVEDGLGGIYPTVQLLLPYSLNPCFSGGWSRRIV